MSGVNRFLADPRFYTSGVARIAHQFYIEVKIFYRYRPGRFLILDFIPDRHFEFSRRDQDHTFIGMV